jgi:hypothetical protein
MREREREKNFLNEISVFIIIMTPVNLECYLVWITEGETTGINDGNE